MFFNRLFNRKRWDKFRKDLTQGIIGNMLSIPSGSFLMGSNNGEMDERPVNYSERMV
jgi:formylglycine-generating enzyme required for sulfatase activity